MELNALEELLLKGGTELKGAQPGGGPVELLEGTGLKTGDIVELGGVLLFIRLCPSIPPWLEGSIGAVARGAARGAARGGTARDGAPRDGAPRDGAPRDGGANPECPGGAFPSPAGVAGPVEGVVFSTELLDKKELGGLKLECRAVADRLGGGRGPLDRGELPFIMRGRGGARAALNRCIRWY